MSLHYLSLIHKILSLRALIFTGAIIAISSVLIFAYIIPDRNFYLDSKYNWIKYKLNQSLSNRVMQLDTRYYISNSNLQSKAIRNATNKFSFDEMLDDDEFSFDIKGNDVIVFLHIQKTGECVLLINSFE